VIPFRRIGTAHRSHLHGSRITIRRAVIIWYAVCTGRAWRGVWFSVSVVPASSVDIRNVDDELSLYAARHTRIEQIWCTSLGKHANGAGSLDVFSGMLYYKYQRNIPYSILILSKFFYSPTDTQVNCLKKYFTIYIKINIKTIVLMLILM